MPSDRSRTSDDLRQSYKAVITQQGRVILDRDFNALQEVIRDELAAGEADIIGPCGTPDDGFKISVETAGSPPALWNPPSPLDPPDWPEQWDFLVAPGTMYLGGQRAVFSARSDGQQGSFSYTYFDQPDWINPPAPLNPVTEVISLHLFEQEVGAVEDPDLLDVALGGPDTTQRIRLMRRVERCSGDSCKDAKKHWKDKGYKQDPQTLRLLPQVALKASYATPASTTSPCDPVVTGGYLGAFNQLIRVETRNPKGGSPTLLWGYDNASFLYRVSVASDGKTLTLAQAPVDSFHQPALHQVVEVLRSAAVLNLNATGPHQQLRCVAEARGHITTLSSGYTGNPDGSGTVTLNSQLPGDYTNDTPLFLRIWQGVTSNDILSDPGNELTDYAGQSTGLTVTLIVPGGETFPEGAFWMIAVRPGTPQKVYPERFLEDAQPPDGPNQWMCPLAVIDWTGSANAAPQVTHDCREKFCNLVGLTKRERASCCTYRVGDGLNTFGDFTSIQEAIKQLPSEGGEICVLPGRYFEAVTIKNRRDIVIHGCGPETRIASPSLKANADAAAAETNGAVITIHGSRNIELRSLAVEAAIGDTGILVAETNADERTKGSVASEGIKLIDLIVATSNQLGISAAANLLHIERCTVGAMQNAASSARLVYVQGREIHLIENWVGLLSDALLPAIVQNDFGKIRVKIEFRAPLGGIQIGGPSRDVYIIRNEIQGGLGNGITLGSLQTIDGNGKVTGGGTTGTTMEGCCGVTLFTPTYQTPSTGDTRLRNIVSGPLANIHIENNRIRNMGLGGIGPVAFFNLEENQEVVSVRQLFIVGNEINDSPNQAIQAIDDKLSRMIGYGAICLSDVSQLVIRDNQILNAGATLSDPACGIFLLHGEQVEISRNQILDERTSTIDTDATISGLRAGISITMVTPPVASQYTTINLQNHAANLEGFDVPAKDEPSPYLASVPALCIFDNVVRVPVGLALSVAGLGAFSIRGNHFATGGTARVGKITLAAGVMILNFGTPIESPNPVTTAAELLKFMQAEAVNEGAGAANAFQIAAAGRSVLRTLAPGPVLFSNNRCSVDLPAGNKDDSFFSLYTSVFITSFDDLGFHDNQCFLQCSELQTVCDVLLLSPTLRATGNRFQEKLLGSLFSNLAVARYNISSLNIATNLLYALGQFQMIQGNLQII